jgi:hypothetical protein
MARSVHLNQILVCGFERGIRETLGRAYLFLGYRRVSWTARPAAEQRF